MSLKIANLTKEYPTRAGTLHVLREVNLTLENGEAIAVMGPSGSGKSTLLYIVGTLEQPTAGTVTIDEQNPFQLSEKALADFRNHNIGFIFQDHHLLPQCSVLENVLIPTLVSKQDKGKTEVWARELIDRVGLADRIDHRPAELSGGERQRVGVARSLINRPSVLLADEPTGNLDQKTAKDVGNLLLELQQQEKIMLITVTHSRELAEIFPRRFHMSEGTLQEDNV